MTNFTGDVAQRDFGGCTMFVGTVLYFSRCDWWGSFHRLKCALIVAGLWKSTLPFSYRLRGQLVSSESSHSKRACS